MIHTSAWLFIVWNTAYECMHMWICQWTCWQSFRKAERESAFFVWTASRPNAPTMNEFNGRAVVIRIRVIQGTMGMMKFVHSLESQRSHFPQQTQHYQANTRTMCNNKPDAVRVELSFANKRMAGGEEAWRIEPHLRSCVNAIFVNGAEVARKANTHVLISRVNNSREWLASFRGIEWNCGRRLFIQSNEIRDVRISLYNCYIIFTWRHGRAR